MTPQLVAYLLAASGKDQLCWSAKDDGSLTGKASFRPTHAYSVYLDEYGSPRFDKRPLQAGEKISSKDLKTVLLHTNPEASRYKSLALGIAAGSFVTLASIITAMLIAQIVMDEEKQQDIFNEAQKAIAICSATQEIQQGNYSAAGQALDKVTDLFNAPAANPLPSPSAHAPAPSEDIHANTSDSVTSDMSNESVLWQPGQNVPPTSAEPAPSSLKADGLWQPAIPGEEQTGQTVAPSPSQENKNEQEAIWQPQ